MEPLHIRNFQDSMREMILNPQVMKVRLESDTSTGGAVSQFEAGMSASLHRFDEVRISENGIRGGGPWTPATGTRRRR